jgi:hypothetical protein
LQNLWRNKKIYQRHSPNYIATCKAGGFPGFNKKGSAKNRKFNVVIYVVVAVFFMAEHYKDNCGQVTVLRGGLGLYNEPVARLG